MELLSIFILLFLSIVLAAVEAFLIPGFGMAGIAALGCFIGANALAFTFYGTVAGFGLLGVSTLLFAGAGYWVFTSRSMDKIALKRNIDSTAASEAQLSIHPGDKGRALTRLALVGNAEIEGRIVEVKSADGFLDEGTPVVVTRVENAQIWVRRK